MPEQRLGDALANFGTGKVARRGTVRNELLCGIYVRVSSDDQTTENQEQALKVAERRKAVSA